MIQKQNQKVSPQKGLNNSSLTESRIPASSPSLNKYKSMLLTESQLQQKSDYFNSLLSKHPAQHQLTQNLIQNKQLLFNQQILEGKYDIKARKWSPEQQLLKANNNKSANETLQAKKYLENELRNIQSQLQEQEQAKKSRIINQEEHSNFLKKMETEKKQLLKRRIQAAKQQQQQRQQQDRKARQLRQQQQLQKKMKKRKSIEQKIKLLEQQQRARIQAHKQQTLMLKQKMKQKTAADKIEEQYYLKQNESLQEKKKRLAQIRMLHKPIDRKELDEFAQKIDNYHKQKLEALNNKEKTLNKSSVVFYKSSFYKRIKQEKKIFQDSRGEQELGKLKEARDKLKKFSQHVRTAYKPSVDQKKVQEMKFRSVNMKNRSLSSAQPINQTPHKIGLRYLQFSKLQIDHQRLLVSDPHSETQQEEKDSKIYDYLAEQRKKNKNKASTSAQDLLEQLQRRQLTKQQKAKKIFQFTNKLQKKAKMREQLERAGTTTADDELDALYLEAIEAKLSLLDDV